MNIIHEDFMEDFPEVPYDHCVECGDPIFRPKKRRCTFCARAKYGDA